MEQYFNLVWKNYTTLRSQNFDENISDEDDASELITNNDLHYQVPFWIGVTVISLLLLSAIVGIIRYCFQALCSTHSETDKTALMSPISPTPSSHVTSTSQRQHSKSNLHQSSSPDQFQDHSSNISIIPIKHQHAKFNAEIHQYFSPSECRTSMNLRKNMHDIYVLPVSPSLSSSSSTTNTDEIIKTNSNSMLIQSQQLNHTHLDSRFNGVKNDCYTDSPEMKNRTLPRLHTATLRRIPAPSQPPPLPPINSQYHDENPSFSNDNFQSDTSILHLRSIEQIQTTKTHPPPVPYRSQKPSNIRIDFEEHIEKSNTFDSQLSSDLSPSNDYSEHPWPNPPESMSTSQQLSRPASIPYDHLTSNPIVHLNSTSKYFPHSMLTESNT